MLTVDQSRANPYPGPDPFTERDSELFFGRYREVLKLASLVRAHYTVLFHSASGAGKTSMVEAGLRPELTRRGCIVLPRARLRQTSQGARLAPNPYVGNLLENWRSEGLTPSTEGADTLVDFLGEQPTGDSAPAAKVRVVILDQFEELFTLYPEHWQAREGFFVQVQQALDADPLLRFLFVMKGDDLARIGVYTHLLKDGLRTRVPLDRLRREHALEAVVGPARAAGRSFDDGVADALIVDLLTLRHEPGRKPLLAEHVEAVELQIVCRELWQRLPADVTVIRREHLTKVGRIDEVLARFYEKAIDETAAGAKVRRRTLRTWFDRKLITPARTRGIVFQDKQSTAGLPNAAVKLLEERRIIHSESRDDAVWYELTHDRFVDAVVNSNRRWVEQRESFRQRQLLVLAVVTTLALVLALLFALPLGRSQRSVSIEDLDRPGEEIGVANEEDSFAVHGSSGSMAILSVRPDGEFDTSLRLLLAKDGFEVAKDPADGRPGSHISVRLPADGEYTVKVTAARPGRYRLRGGVVDEETAAGRITHTQFNHRGEVDVYTFRQDKPGVALAWMRSEESDLDGFIELVGPDKKLVAAVDDTGDAKDPLVAMFLSVPGTYRVEASAADHGKGRYEMTIEHGAAPLLGSKPLSGAVGFAPQFPNFLHQFRFQGLPGDLVIARMQSDGKLDCYLWLFSPRGDLLAEAGNANGLDAVVASVVSDPGQHVVVASGRRKEGKTSEGSFHLSLRREASAAGGG
jgi:hypothetical protein